MVLRSKQLFGFVSILKGKRGLDIYERENGNRKNQVEKVRFLRGRLEFPEARR